MERVPRLDGCEWQHFQTRQSRLIGMSHILTTLLVLRHVCAPSNAVHPQRRMSPLASSQSHNTTTMT